VKVHAEDVRYIMIGSAIEFPDLVDRIREKFGLRKRFKIKVRDEDMPNGDMITMGDQDDLDMVLMSVKAQAKRERLDMGKMEVSFNPMTQKLNLRLIIYFLGLDTRTLNPRSLLKYLHPLFNQLNNDLTKYFMRHLFILFILTLLRDFYICMHQNIPASAIAYIYRRRNGVYVVPFLLLVFFFTFSRFLVYIICDDGGGKNGVDVWGIATSSVTMGSRG